MWPFKRKQAAVDGDYTGTITAAVEAAAASGGGRHEVTGYIQAAAGAWAETLALCEVAGPSYVRAALTPSVLSEIGRDLITQGGAFYRSRFQAGRLTLERPLSVYRLASGGGWQLQIGEPSNPHLLNVLDAECVYLPWQTAASNPYAPIPPWRNATGRLGTELEETLRAEIAGPVGAVLFLASPMAFADGTARERNAEQMTPKLDFSGQRRGGLAILQNPNQSAPAGRAFSTDSGLRPHRIGAAPPEALGNLRAQLGGEILAACGIPPAMLAAGASGPATITARRNFERATVPARLAILSDLLSKAFMERVTLTYPVKYRADISTAARTVKALTDAGVQLDQGLEFAGLKP